MKPPLIPAPEGLELEQANAFLRTIWSSKNGIKCRNVDEPVFS
jgi:hypothetical protein